MRLDNSLRVNAQTVAGNMSIRAAQAAAQKAEAAKGETEDAKLRQACNDFESILVTQMFTTMRNAGPKADLFGSGEKEEMFQSMLDEERAKELCKNDFLKLGDAMYAQLTRGRPVQVSGKLVDTHTGKESG